MCLKCCKYHMIRYVGTSPKSAIWEPLWASFGSPFGSLWANFSFQEPSQKGLKKVPPNSNQKMSPKVVLHHSPGVDFLTFLGYLVELFFLGSFLENGGYPPLKDF